MMLVFIHINSYWVSVCAINKHIFNSHDEHDKILSLSKLAIYTCELTGLPFLWETFQDRRVLCDPQIQKQGIIASFA